MHFFSAVKKAEAFFPGAQLERDDVTFLARRKSPFLTGITAFEKLPKFLIYKGIKALIQVPKTFMDELHLYESFLKYKQFS